jgi:hypothetical protein
MELDAIVAAALIGHGRIRGIVGTCDGPEARRQRLDAIAVAHPDIEHRAAVALAINDALEQAAWRA